MTWYRRLKAPGSRAARRRYAMTATHVERNRKPPRKRNPKAIFYKEYSTSLYINGQKAKVCSRYQIAKFFAVPTSTIVKWSEAGLLPEPFMYRDRGDGNYPLYLCAQIRCLIVVVNDLIDDGYVSLPWVHLPEHVDMIRDGYDQAQQSIQKRHMTQDDDTTMGRFGVEFED